MNWILKCSQSHTLFRIMLNTPRVLQLHKSFGITLLSLTFADYLGFLIFTFDTLEFHSEWFCYAKAWYYFG